MASFDQFIQRWLTNPPSRVADPLLAGDHPYQCVSLIKEGLSEIDGLAMTNSWWGNAIDYWTKTNPAILSTRIAVPTQDIQRGDVVVLRTNGTNPGDFSGYGHIGWATGQQNATQFELLEQNGSTGNGLGDGGDAIRTRWIPKSRIAGVLRGKLVAPYSITQVDPYKRDVLAGHQKWNLDQPNFDAVANNPILTLNQQTTITVAAELHHHHPTLQQYTYLLEDPNVPQGYNQLDTVAYTPPAPAYVPPAAPVPVKLAPKVELITEVPYYENSTNAKTAYKEAGRLKAGTYYQISTDFGMWNLSSDNMKDLQHWVNPKDNVLPTPKSPPIPAATPVPAPEPMAVFVPKLSDSDKASFKSFTPERKPITFVLEYDYLFTDLNGYATRLANGKYVAKTVQRHMYDEVEFSGSFFHDGREWARVYIVDKNNDLDKNVWFACPMLNSFTHTPYITPHDKIYEVDTTPAERLSLKHPTPYDKFIQFGATVDVLYSKLHKTIDGFYRQKHK